MCHMFACTAIAGYHDTATKARKTRSKQCKVRTWWEKPVLVHPPGTPSR